MNIQHLLQPSVLIEESSLTFSLESTFRSRAAALILNPDNQTCYCIIITKLFFGRSIIMTKLKYKLYSYVVNQQRYMATLIRVKKAEKQIEMN